MKVLVLVLLVSVSWSMDRRRNGGNIVKCGHQIQTLDLFEASYTFPVSITTGLNEIEIASKIIDRIEKKEPKRAELYSKWLQDFKTEAKIFDNATLVRINDIGEGMVIPNNCEVIQVVSQVVTPAKNTPRYLINGDVWKELSKENQAALILHELIYREQFQLNSKMTDSVSVRAFNAYLHSEAISTDSVDTYLLTLSRIGIQNGYYQNFPILLKDIEFSTSGKIVSALLKAPYKSSSGIEISCVSPGTDEIRITFASLFFSSSCLTRVEFSNSQFYGFAYSRTFAMSNAERLLYIDFAAEIPPTDNFNFFYASAKEFLENHYSKRGIVRFQEDGSVLTATDYL